jgi:threonine dehydrogenase-like Zn-dependent dehydrogenase
LEGCGICGSNLAHFEGRPWFTYPRDPGDPGHEGWGEIESLGVNVSGFKRGERVAFLSYRAYAEFDIAHYKHLVRLPQSLEKKPFPGEALGCAMNVFRRAEITAGQKVAVVGIGFMGALLSGLAAERGAEVIAITRRPFGRRIAREMGAQHIVAMDDHYRIIEQVKGITGGKFCDVVIEAVGAQWPIDLSAELTKERGRLVIAGYHQDGPRQVNMQLWNWRGLDVINAHERDPQIYIRGMAEAVEAVVEGRINPAALYTHSYRLEQIGEAFAAMRDRPEGFLKGLITL